MTHKYLIIIICLFCTTKIKAQLPDSSKIDNRNIKTLKKDSVIKKKASWFYNIGFDGTVSSGSVNRELLNIKSSLNFESPKYIFGFFTHPRFQFGTNANTLQEREIFLDLNSTLFYLQHNVYLLAFGAFEQSNLRKITTRYNIGAGIGWKIIGGNNKPKSPVKLSLSNVLVHEVTDFVTKQDIILYRNSTRFKLIISLIPEKLTINSVIFIQPSLIDNYFRWNSSSQLSYKVGKHLSVLASFENTFENFNPELIQNTQTNATIGLTYSSSN